MSTLLSYQNRYGVEAVSRLHFGVRHVLGFFDYDHLPSKLQGVSAPFQDLAMQVAFRNSHSPETTVALRKLLEAKDCAVRAALEVTS